MSAERIYVLRFFLFLPMYNLQPGVYLQRGDNLKSITSLTGIPGLSTETGRKSVDELATSVTYLYACYRLRSDKLAGLPRSIVKENGDEIDEDALPFAIDVDDLLWRIEYALNLYGAAYLFKQTNISGSKVQRVRWFDPSTISPVVDSGRGLYAFKRQLSAAADMYPVATDGFSPNIVWMWQPGIAELAPGPAIGSVLQTAAEVLRSINEFSDKFFDQGAISPLLLVVPNTASKEEKERLETRFGRFAMSVQNAFKPVAVSADIEVKQLSFPPADLAMGELSERTRDEILAATGVPISMVLGTSVNYATAQQESANFIENVLEPRARFVASRLNRQLFAPAGLRLRFHPDQLSVMQRDEMEGSQAFLNLVNGGMNPAAAAFFLGYDPEELPEDTPLFAPLPELPPMPEPQPAPVVAEVQPAEDAKAIDLGKWQRKAMKALTKTGSAAVAFESEHIDEAEADGIASALELAETVDEIDAIFAADYMGHLSYEGYP